MNDTTDIIKNRTPVNELNTDDRDVFVVLNNDDGKDVSSSHQNSIVVTFEVEEGHKTTTYWDVIFDRSGIELGADENEIREKMRAFGVASLQALFSGEKKKEEKIASPDGYILEGKRLRIERDPILEGQCREKITKILDSNSCASLMRAMEKQFPSNESILVRNTIGALKNILKSIDSRGLPYYVSYISRTDKPKYLDNLDSLYKHLSETPNLASIDETTRTILNDLDSVHVKIGARNRDMDMVDWTKAKIENSLSLLDEVHKRKPDLEEVLKYLNSFSESKDQARRDIVGNIARIFNDRSKNISEIKWFKGGLISSFVVFLYLLAAITHFQIPWLDKSEWFGSANNPYIDMIIRVAIISILSYVTIFCFRQYVYERKAREIYEFKQASLNAMSSLIEVHKGDQNQTAQIMTHALPHIFSESNVNSEKHQSSDANHPLFVEVMKLVRQQR